MIRGQLYDAVSNKLEFEVDYRMKIERERDDLRAIVGHFTQERDDLLAEVRRLQAEVARLGSTELPVAGVLTEVGLASVNCAKCGQAILRPDFGLSFKVYCDDCVNAMRPAVVRERGPI